MSRIHFIDGSTLDIYLDIEDLTDSMNRMTNARFIMFDDMAIVIDNITYVEKLKVNKEEK